MAKKNEKKKFRFNLVDVIIIVIIVCAVVFAVRYFSDHNGGATATDTFYLTFYGEEVPDYVIPNAHPGDSVYDFDDKNNLGNIVDVKTDVSQTYVETDDGHMVLGPKENYSSVYITVEVRGTRSEHGVVVNGILYAVGHSVVLYAGDGKFFLKAYKIAPAAEPISYGIS